MSITMISLQCMLAGAWMEDDPSNQSPVPFQELDFERVHQERLAVLFQSRPALALLRLK